MCRLSLCSELSVCKADRGPHRGRFASPALETDLASASFVASTLPSISTTAQTLSRQLTEWAHTIPSYELRRCEAELKSLNELISATSAKSNPKPKFSFKKKAPAASTSAPTPPAPTPSSSTPPPTSKPPPIPPSALTLTSSTPRYLSCDDLPTSTSANAEALVISGLKDCVVDLVGKGKRVERKEGASSWSALYLYDLAGSTVLVPPLSGSLMVHGCQDCTLVVGGHQFRMHSSTRCRVFLQISGKPIIEGCSGLIFGPYPTSLSDAPLPPSTFAQIQDFDYPFAKMFASLFPVAVLASSAMAAVIEPRGVLEPRSNLTASAVGFHMPAPRAWRDDSDSKGPCGGARGGQISLLNRRDGDDVQIRYSTKADPTKNSDFKELVPTQNELYRGHYCFNISTDFASVDGVAAGAPMTLQVIYKAGVDDTTLYQCADVNLVDAATYTMPHGLYCINGHLQTETVDLESYADSHGLSGGAKGGIAAGVVVGVLALSGLAFFFYRKRSAKKVAARREADNATLHSDNMRETTKHSV
ncbi:hypothetical protein MNV49_006621 [Pseudohyphozyma bogoriensis]|nr:hypothetical protein MNV49_006621 [Pseudohyphozyma bogoriensis]